MPDRCSKAPTKPSAIKEIIQGIVASFRMSAAREAITTGL